MSTQQNKDVVRHFCDRFSQGDVDGMEQQVAEDFVDHHPFNPQGDRKGAREAWESLTAAFPDLKVEPEEMVAERDLVMGRFTITGTHQGEILGLSPSGKSFQITALDMMRVSSDGKITEYWGNPDQLSLLRQLGALPG